MPDDTTGGSRSLWYALTGKQQHAQKMIVAATGASGNCCLMCVTCGHVFVDGEPFANESAAIGNVTLARSLYYHSCDDEGQASDNRR